MYPVLFKFLVGAPLRDIGTFQKNWFYEQNNCSACASRFLVHFFFHRSVSLKYLRFPDQHIKGNIDSLNDTGNLTMFYTGSHCSRNEKITHVYTIFD